MHHIMCRVFWQNIKSPTWLSPTTAQIWCPVTSGFLAFPQTKITFEREEISDHDEIQENTTGQLMAIGRTGWGPTLKGTEASLSCVQCFLCLVSSSANACFSWRAAGDLLDRPSICIYIFIHMHHIFFILSSVSGHLGCFYVLITVNDAAVNTEGHMSLRSQFQFLWIYAEKWDCWII